MKKKVLSVFLSICMIVSCMVGISITAGAAGSVNYLDKDGTNKSCTTYTAVSESTTVWSDGWYVVDNKTTIYNRVTVTGDVKLILCDGITLTVPNGITVEGTDKLTIYAQSTVESAMGALSVNSTSGCAGIGGGDRRDGGNITINGGKVTAAGGRFAAGIGGGYYGNGGNITINGGNITTYGSNNTNYGRHNTNYGSDSAAGIGGGHGGAGGNITINDGEVTATGGDKGAGIGGGYYGASGNITINGGMVTANGGFGGGVGIGAGSYNSRNYQYDGTITINGGKVTAKGAKTGAGIGGCYGGNDSKINILGGQVTVIAGEYASAIEAGKSASDANIILGWKDTDDFIDAQGKYDGTVSFIEGKKFVLGGTTSAAYWNSASDNNINNNKITAYQPTETTKVIDKSSTKLKWDPVSGATSYTVYIAKNGKWVKLTSTKKTSINVSNLKNNKTYKFLVRAKVNGKLTPVKKSYKLTVKN